MVYTDTPSADIYLTKEAKDKLVDKADNKTENPLLPAMKQGADYDFNYGNLQYFQQKLDAFQKANPQASNVEIKYDESGSSTTKFID
jgi:cell division protease FtsH